MERTKKQIESIRIDLGKKYAQSLVDEEGYLETENVGMSCLFYLVFSLKTANTFLSFFFS